MKTILNTTTATAHDHNFIKNIVELVLPYIVSILEILGIVVVVWSAIYAFWEFVQNTFFKTKNNIQYHLAIGLATGLEFKMAAEILNTVLIKSARELLILGAVIILRAILSFLIHFEMRGLSKD